MRRLTQERSDLTAAADSLRRENARLRSGDRENALAARVSSLENENRILAEAIDSQKAALKAARRQAAAVQKENERLNTALCRQQAASERFQTEAREVIEEVVSLNRCEASCPSFDLCRKRILIVGGITRMEALYRELIEGSGGIFEYHDGYMKNGVRNLESRLKRADVVLCPVGCNSHAACTLVKNLGKKHNKPVHMLTSSSLSAVSQALQTKDAGSAGVKNDGSYMTN
jgi:hypothetical protein